VHSRFGHCRCILLDEAMDACLSGHSFSLPKIDSAKCHQKMPSESLRLFFGLSNVSETNLFTNPLD
jgi:hypothetical protein